MTLTEIKHILANAYSELYDKRSQMAKENLDAINSYFIITRIADEKYLRMSAYCTKCETYSDGDPVLRSSWMAPKAPAKCPNCGEGRFVITSSAKTYSGYYTNHSTHAVYGVYDVNDEYAIVYSLYFRVMATPVPAETNELSLKKSTLSIANENYVHLKVGIVQYDKNHPWMLNYSSGNYSLYSGWEFLDTHYPIVDEKMEKLIENVCKRVPGTTVENINSNILSMCAKNEAKTVRKPSSAAERKKEFVEKCQSYVAHDATLVQKLVKTAHNKNCTAPFRTAKVSAGYSHFLSYCPSCGEKIEYKQETEKKDNFPISIICPRCGEEHSYNYREYYVDRLSEIYYFHWSYVDELEAVLIRVFIGDTKFKKEPGSEEKTVSRTREVGRAFLGKKDSAFFWCTNLRTIKSELILRTSIDFCGLYNRLESRRKIAINDEDELRSIINKSHLKYSGVSDAWGLGPDKSMKYEEPGTFDSDSYLYVWNTKHFIELLMKTGLTKIVRQIAMFKKTASNIKKPRAKNVCDMLGITKPVFKIAQEINPTIEDLNIIQKLWQADNSLTVDTYRLIAGIGNESLFIEIKDKFGIPFDKQVAYLKDCYDYQCIERAEAMQLWYDYLNLAKKVGYKIKSKNVKYPESLKKEHDICAFVENRMTKEFDDKAFSARAKENSKYEYSLKSVKLFVSVPKNPQEVINEGMTLHHCVTNYVNAIIEGRSVVMFIRNEDEPDEPFFTAEILMKGGAPTITQVKGNMNTDPDATTKDGKRVAEFVKKWAAFKHLNVDVKI